MPLCTLHFPFTSALVQPSLFILSYFVSVARHFFRHQLSSTYGSTQHPKFSDFGALRVATASFLMLRWILLQRSGWTTFV